MKVLIPLDGSRPSYDAMVAALRMLKGVSGARFTALNVRNAGMEDAPEDLVAATEADEEDEIFPTEAASRKCLDRAVELAKKEGARLETKIVAGNPSKAILEEARHHDLLVMHELSGSNLRDLVRFSTTEKLARKAPCSVLLVRTNPPR